MPCAYKDIHERVIVLKTRLTSLLNIERPIIQGGLAYLANADLAIAVSNAGGLGQITATNKNSPEELRDEIRKVRQETSKPFGVNIPISRVQGSSYEAILDVVIEEEVPVVTMTGGNPKPLLERLKHTPIKKLVLVSTVYQAQKAEDLGADAVMAVGQEGGGHIGRDDLGTIVLIPRVVDAVKIPVVASGGIGDGRGYLAAFALGADGIEMGTRFVATKECTLAHPLYKQLLLENDELGTAVIKRSLGMPARAIKTPLVQKILEMEEKGATYDDLKDYISGECNKRLIHEGKLEEGFGWAGQVMGLIDDIPSVQELFDRMEQEARSYLAHCQQVFAGEGN